jgi:hypothetical protein
MKKVTVQITGGLGNQLFQFAAGLSLIKDELEPINIEEKLGKPRSADGGTADIFGFVLPQTFNIISIKSGRVSEFMSRVTGFCLRLGVIPSKIESNRVIKSFIIFIASVLLSLFLKERKLIQIGNGVGYTELGNRSSVPYLIGYFQSYLYAERNHDHLMKLKIGNLGPELKELTVAAETEMPLVVHCRFGDYLLESDFGIPSKEYYQAAISGFLANGICKSIWVFSDDLIRAKEKLDLNIGFPIRWISAVDNSDVSTLQAMRLGRGFVIANSTFSWWAAYLSMNPNAEVVAPTPWFMGMEDPVNLIPPRWRQLDAGYQGKR